MLSLVNLSIYVSGKTLLKSIIWKVERGQRIGLVGPNGAGKSTLLKTISGKRQADEGTIDLMRGTKIGFLEQETLELDIALTVREFARQAFAEIKELSDKIDVLADKIGYITDFESDEYQNILDQMQEAQERIDVLDGDKVEGKIEQVLTGLGFPEKDLDRGLEEFSGGWRMRAAIARLLLRQPDLLLLDEPTNHLDIDSIGWMENYLAEYSGAVIIVSHDKYFLDKMVNGIAEINQNSITSYTGNYSKYEEARQMNRELQQARFENQQKQLADTEKFIDRFRYKASKAKAVQSRVKQLEKVERITAPDDDNPEIAFRFPAPPRAGKVVLEIAKLNKNYPVENGRKVVVFDQNQDLHIERGSKIAIIGPNGAGKSTLARICRGIEPFDGELKLGHNVIESYFAQHLAEELEGSNTVLEELERSAKTSEARQRVRSILGAFLFSGEDVEKHVGVLSGGEKSRLALAKILLEPVNFIILDEPTNHLDIASKRVLAQAIKNFEGTVLAISHDRHFITMFADTVWRAEGGRITEYEGGYDYYEWKHAQEIESAKVVAKAPTPAKVEKGVRNVDHETSKEERKRRNKLQNDLKRAESEVADLTKEKNIMEDHLADPETYLDPNYHRKVKDFDQLKSRLEEAEFKWLQLSEEWDSINQE